MPQGGAGAVAAGRERGGQRRDRRPAGALHRHRDVAERRRSAGDRPTTETFIKERMHQETGRSSRSGSTTRACSSAVRERLAGLFESTRYARGHKARKTFELNGDDGSLRFDLESRSISTVRVPRPGGESRGRSAAGGASTSPTASIPIWATGGCRGWRSATSTASSTRLADFLAGSSGGEPVQPDFAAALETQKVCEAVLRSAAAAVGRRRGSGRDRTIRVAPTLLRLVGTRRAARARSRRSAGVCRSRSPSPRSPTSRHWR